MTEEQAKTCQAFADAYRDAVDYCKSMSDLDIHIREEMESKGYHMIDEDRPHDFRNYEPVPEGIVETRIITLRVQQHEEWESEVGVPTSITGEDNIIEYVREHKGWVYDEMANKNNPGDRDVWATVIHDEKGGDNA